MTPCRICRSSETIKLFTKNKIDIVRCKHCGLEYTDRSPSVDLLRDIYSERYFSSKGAGTSFFDYLFEEKAMAVNALKRLEGIRKFKEIAGKSRLLDIGCATGVFLEAASGLCDVEGVELSEFASRYAREKKGLAVKTGTLLEAALPDGHFDVITMWDVVEHIPSPLEDLREVRRVMKDDGLFVLTTGDVESLLARICGKNWHLYNPEQHLSYFSGKTMELLLSKTGFRVLKMEKKGSLFTLAYLASNLAMYYPSAITRSLFKAVHSSPLSDLRLCVNLFDILTIYAEKSTA